MCIVNLQNFAALFHHSYVKMKFAIVPLTAENEILPSVCSLYFKNSFELKKIKTRKVNLENV